MVSINFDKINSNFRYLVDLVFFTNRFDIDLSNFNSLLKDHTDHVRYLIDRFEKSSEIHWENGEQFWFNRISFLFSLNNKEINKFIGRFFEKRFLFLVKFKDKINPKYDLSYLQFLQYCKVKHSRGENLSFIRKNLLELPATTNDEKLLLIINSFIPVVFKDIDEYVENISQKITMSARNFEILQALEKRQIIFDREPVVKLAKEIITDRIHSFKNVIAFFTIINDKTIHEKLKQEYLPEYRTKIINLLSNCDSKILEESHLRNIENIINLDNSLADEAAKIYVGKIYSRYNVHKKANADRVIRLLKKFDQISPKKILVYLSGQNKTSDIKYLVKSFPELEKFLAFV
jgi:hypothetical protein